MSAAAAKRPRSASAIVASTASGYHLLKIDGYSRTKGVPTGDRIKSRAFTIGGHRWYINYHPNGLNSEHAEYISLILFLQGQVADVKAQYEFRFADEVKDQAPSLTSAAVNTFTSKEGWGRWGFIKRADLEKSEHLKDDSFTVRCDVVVINDYHVLEDLPQITPPVFVSVAPSDLHKHLGELLETEKGADVVFEVGGETFAAHRCVLAARSPVFSAELFGGMKEGNTATGVVRIDDMEAEVFKALLCFTYTDSLPAAAWRKSDEEDVMCQHLLVAADRYGMDRLKSICEEKLCSYIDVGTVATILALAEQHRCDGLKKACLNFLGTPANLRALLDSHGFDHLSRSCPSIIKSLISISNGISIV